jgi:magnesium-transporting ATPase (P-type)
MLLVLGSEGLEVDESLLTGEAESIVKKAGDKVLSGSIVVAGEGFVRAVAWRECLRPFNHSAGKAIQDSPDRN